MTHVFGPVSSRRLGLSLGVDLIPAKTCSYDCLYCQAGRTTDCFMEPKPLIPVQGVIQELKQKLELVTPDIITFSGSGEPTLHSEIDRVIAFIKTVTDIPIALLTNGSLLWKKEVRERILGAHIIMPTLSTASEETFRMIHRPCPGLNLARIIEGLRRFREIYEGRLFLEVILLAGINDSDKELEGLKKVIEQISPDRVQLNTVVRPPADGRALSLDRTRLEEIKNFMGPKTEIIAEVSPKGKTGRHDTFLTALAEMAKRRPLRVLDAAHVLDVPLEEAERLIKGLMMKGGLRRQEHAGEVFYVSTLSENRHKVQ